MISETLNAQVDKFVLKHLFGDEPIKAYIRLIPSIRKNIKDEISLYRDLYDIGVPLALSDIRERFNLPMPKEEDILLSKNKNSEVNHE